MRGLQGNKNAQIIKAINRRIKKIALGVDFDDEESKKNVRQSLRVLMNERKRFFEKGKLLKGGD